MKYKTLKYHYFYKITNNINNHFYYGVHNTDNLNDGYMGSGKRLHIAYKKYGIENFTKEILKFFDTMEEAFEYESEIVTEALVMDDNCYNLKLGGQGFCTSGLVTVKDKDGNTSLVSLNDPRYLSGELVPVATNTCTVKNKDGYVLTIPLDDPRYLSGELVGVTKGFITVKDKNNNYYFVSVDDPRYISGELVPIWEGRKHSKESIQKQKDTYKRTKHQQGERNSCYGTCWITKDYVNKKIKKEELLTYEQNGWKLGRYVTSSRDFSKYPTYEEIQQQYDKLKNYDKVAKVFNITRSQLFYLRQTYEKK